MDELQQKARAAGLWNLGLPELGTDEPGTRLSNLEYAPLAEIMGRLFWAPEVFNCQAPDVPNMIALQNCATAANRRTLAAPLLEAETRSAFGDDRTGCGLLGCHQYRDHNCRDHDDYIINGTQMVHHRRCASAMQLPDRDGRDQSDADRTRRHSCVIVPMDAPGVRLVRPLRWMGCEDHVAPIGELAFDNVRVPRSNLLGEEGEGFKVAQVRLGRRAFIIACARSGCVNS
jgi:acyl-CoA dehydrogenase